jgi:DeoR family transcriptional regulator, aga operon transcriptional repressor
MTSASRRRQDGCAGSVRGIVAQNLIRTIDGANLRSGRQGMSSKTDKRAKEILRLLLSHGKTSVEELTSLLGTSPASVRRDLVRLEEQGLVHRTHGGALLAGQIYEPFRFDSSFHVREGRFAAEKKRIAKAAAELIVDSETVGFTAGTTTTEVARQLGMRTGLHIITNAVNIGLELNSNKGPETTLTGGCIRWPGAFSLVGPAAIESLNAVVMDKVFIGVCGVDPEHGATIIEAEEAAVFRAMSRRAKQVFIVADSSKVGMTSPSVICTAGDIDILITDDGVSDDAVNAFRRSDVRVLIV